MSVPPLSNSKASSYLVVYAKSVSLVSYTRIRLLWVTDVSLYIIFLIYIFVKCFIFTFLYGSDCVRFILWMFLRFDRLRSLPYPPLYDEVETPLQ